jgi:hypothetical protein
MNLGYVVTFFGVILMLGIALPGLLLAWRLLLPTTVVRARQRLDLTPGRCLALGSITGLPILVVIAGLLALPGVFQLLGWIGLLFFFTLASLGAAGLVSLMSSRLPGGAVPDSPGALVRSAVALELAILFPFIGWFVLLPLLTLLTWGSALFALLGWQARPKLVPIASEVGHVAQSS